MKLEEAYPPDIRELRRVSEYKFSREDMESMEMDILVSLEF
jgi:hypothetical protein